jgi:hypothetical protein
MPCDLGIINADVTLDCNDIPVGGIIKAMVAKYDDITAYTEVDGELTAITVASDKVIDLEFNSKDGFSNFTDEKTVDESGIVTAVPSVMLEFPKMTLNKRNALENLSTSGLDLVIFIETASGVKHALGLDFGMQGSEVNGKSGAGRTEKNSYDIKFTGEETNLSRLIDDTTWTSILTNVKAIV